MSNTKPIRVYVASPYTHEDSRLMDRRFRDIAYDVNSLMEQCGKDFAFFSPICHSHPISEAAGHIRQKDGEFWGTLNDSIPRTWVDVMIIIATQDEVDKSKGIQAEIKIAEEENIKIIKSYELSVVISKLRMFQIDKKLITDVTKKRQSAEQPSETKYEIPYNENATYNIYVSPPPTSIYDNSNVIIKFSPDKQPSEYKSFFGLLELVKTETLKNAGRETIKVGCYNYDDAFFHKKFDQEKEEFLTAIRYGVEEDYEVKAASYIGYVTGWCNKIIKEAKNEK